ncbi:MAG: tRNA (adenosine(37)-N6)-threonylcarbamoyltransferase complex ATPase subunit type 1 TsaE [Candidatus Omnitrophica bacterium]|nr:tRNA (adenosine(37)-N6)-threonylcarbamoyltransferase complex ATPase subunit type 1 TsaE [Candidatus Omnitrophota bacterium]MBU0878584.1 tRNA (adenosine(37)-N6)-threonylcarbamoyltransferase complex ATPase subunit type 1 TsaE [Candidatus Omnitrophota bacterium]MBU0896336.1 tRNA (adenosine(37)-N6)-threonylcarbamoyltransferase complex ATPase subunit type 1 TsaE [Candidatus Omnitrophota bacterium]MBU1134264.1 tRNA (adenosine(37)-N6)-threonylcarbamoyltransferase complex ATPase subunit type 1 TsaE [
MIKRETHFSQETVSLGRKFSHILEEKDVVILEGALGGGKTTFIKGILEGLRYNGEVLSPSFTLVREYETKSFQIYHVDLYRVDKKIDIVNLGIEDYLYAPRTIILIEWGEKIKTILHQYIKVEFFFLTEFSRRIIFSSKGYKEKDKSRPFLRGNLPAGLFPKLAEYSGKGRDK